MKTIAFLGDSITFGYSLDDKSVKYSTVLSEKLGLAEENYGITGTLMAKAGLNNEDGKDFVSRMGLIDSADVAVIFGGTNDYFWSDKPISGGEDDSYFEHALETLCKHVCKARAGKITLFVTPYPHNGIGNFLGGEHWKDKSRHDTSALNFNNQRLADYVSVIESVCKKYDLPCLNLHNDFYFEWEKHTTDGCHPNEEGHMLIAEAVYKKLKELF